MLEAWGLIGYNLMPCQTCDWQGIVQILLIQCHVFDFHIRYGQFNILNGCIGIAAQHSTFYDNFITL